MSANPNPSALPPAPAVLDRASVAEKLADKWRVARQVRDSFPYMEAGFDRNMHRMEGIESCARALGVEREFRGLISGDVTRDPAVAAVEHTKSEAWRDARRESRP